MTTQTVRQVENFALICAGLGASGIFAIIDTESQIITDWDDESLKSAMMALDDDDFLAEAEYIIYQESLNWAECANCETHFPDDDAHTSDHYEGSTCCDDCHNEMIDLHVRCKGDPYHDWRTY